MWIIGLGTALSVSRLGQGQAREAETEKSDVSGANLSRATGQLGLTRVEWQADDFDRRLFLGRDPQDHVAVAFARPAHRPQTGDDGMVEPDQAFAALVGCVLVADAAERERG
jgi:hypothetical protein